MYAIDPPSVLAHESVMANPVFRGRVQRVASALRNPKEIIPFRDEELSTLVRAHRFVENRRPMRQLSDVRDPVLLFNTFRFDSRAGEEKRIKAAEEQGVQAGGLLRPLLGGGAFHWFDSNLCTDRYRDDKVCRPCWRIHLQNGCLHKCMYCGFGGVLVSMVNIEEYCQHLGALIDRHPWQTTYLLDDDADPPGLEPELGTLGYLIEYFGTLKDRYLIIHTKTWNTEWMRSLKHNGNTIIVWSITGPTQSRDIEPDTGTTEQRIEAARIAEEAGYQIRYKFKPIIPVRQWRQDASDTIRLIFEQTHPDVISLCCFMWMDVDEMKRRLPIDLLDPVYLRAAEDSQEEVKDTRAKPFPEWVRSEIYQYHLDEIRRYSPDVPVSLSTENWRMWKAFSEKLGMNATNYVCGCGPQSTPGHRVLTCNPFRVAVRSDEGIPGVFG